MIVTPTVGLDLTTMPLQHSQRNQLPVTPGTPLDSLYLTKHARTLRLDDTTAIAILGIVPQLHGSGIAWALLREGWRSYRLSVTKFAKRCILAAKDEFELDRIYVYTVVDYANEPAREWAEMLGFLPDGHMEEDQCHYDRFVIDFKELE
jgi:GNAT superfamily N-acetyltransferase